MAGNAVCAKRRLEPSGRQVMARRQRGGGRWLQCVTRTSTFALGAIL